MTAGASAGSGCPGCPRSGRPIGAPEAPRQRPPAPRSGASIGRTGTGPAEPLRQRGERDRDRRSNKTPGPRRRGARHAFSAISPPIPAGSPIVRASGSSIAHTLTSTKAARRRSRRYRRARMSSRWRIRASATSSRVGAAAAAAWPASALLAHHDHADPVFFDDRLRGLPNPEPQHHAAHRRRDLRQAHIAFARQLGRPLLADPQHVRAILRLLPSAFSLGQRRPALGFARLRAAAETPPARCAA